MRNNKGFTFVEFMIVLAIIGIFATAAIPRYMDDPSERSQRMSSSDIENRAIQLYGSKYSYKHFTVEEIYLGIHGYEYKFYVEVNDKTIGKIKSAEIECNVKGDCHFD